MDRSVLLPLPSGQLNPFLQLPVFHKVVFTLFLLFLLPQFLIWVLFTGSEVQMSSLWGRLECWLWAAPSWRSRAALGWLQGRCDATHCLWQELRAAGAVSHSQEHPHLPRGFCSASYPSYPSEKIHPSVSDFCIRKVWACFEGAKAPLKQRQRFLFSMLLSSRAGWAMGVPFQPRMAQLINRIPSLHRQAVHLRAACPREQIWANQFVHLTAQGTPCPNLVSCSFPAAGLTKAGAAENEQGLALPEPDIKERSCALDSPLLIFS